MEYEAIAIPPLPNELAAIPTPMLADTIERLIDELDARGGDPDAEPNGDELDGCVGEDDPLFHEEHPIHGNGPGCPLSDPAEDNHDQEGIDEREPEHWEGGDGDEMPYWNGLSLNR